MEVKCELIGELIMEAEEKPTGNRILADEKAEGSSGGQGTLLGKEVTIMVTGVLTPMPNGVMMTEGNALVMTSEGGVVMAKIGGIGWFTGKDLKTSARGACYFMTNSPKLERLNKIVGVYERESDEMGNSTVKVWAWK